MLVDDRQSECSDAANVDHRIFDRTVTIGPNNEPVRLEITWLPTALWVCVQVTNDAALGRRVVVPLSIDSVVSFAVDGRAPVSYQEVPPTVTSRPSSACQLATGGTRTRLVNARIGSSHVWSYALREPTGVVHACNRIETSSTGTGGRVTIDSTASGPVVVSPDVSPCTTNVLTDSGPPPYSIRTSNLSSGSPVSVCVSAAGLNRRVTVSGSAPAPARFAMD
jgi:hypothetical protein